MLIPVNVEPFSMVAGYLGIFGFFFAGLPGLFAVASGIIGLKQLKLKTESKGVARAWTGIVLGTIQCILLTWLIFLL